MVRLVCWNTNHIKKSWYCLRDMDVDVALVQEACGVPDEVLSIIDTGPREHWDASVWNSCWWVGLRTIRGERAQELPRANSITCSRPAGFTRA